MITGLPKDSVAQQC